MTFGQPFNAGNPLTIAKKIVDSDYQKIQDDFYTEMLKSIVEACMTND